MSENQKQPEEQKFIIDDKESLSTKDNEMNERINKLFGEENNRSQKELKEYDPAELLQARKKLLLLFVGVIVAGVIIIVLLFNPLELNFGKNNNEQNQEENNDPNESEVPEYPLTLNIYDEKVISLNQQIEFSVEEQQQVDLFPLYINENIVTNDIPNEIKIAYLKKNTNFYDMLIKNKVNEYAMVCNPEGVAISKDEFDQVYRSVFGNDALVNYSNINYEILTEDDKTKKITLAFDTDKYVVTCSDYSVSDSITKLVQQDLIKAIETENTIELYQKIVFITYSGNIGVYKEPSFTTLITNDKTASLEDYINLGNTYKYTFEKDKEKFYLSKIELVKEDN